MEWMLLPFKRYADFKGRSRRMEYWMFFLFQMIVIILLSIVLGVILAMSGGITEDPTSSPVFWIIMGIGLLAYLVIFFIPGLAVTVRRWHDQDKTGWFILILAVLGAIPVVGILASIANIVFMCLPGTVGPNKYGEDPMQAEHLGDVFS